MTKQEEIREGIKPYLHSMLTASEYGELDEESFDSRILEIFQYLHSQGVVLKVDRELPERDYYSAYPTVIDKAQKDMIEAGYVAVEPLI